MPRITELFQSNKLHKKQLLRFCMMIYDNFAKINGDIIHISTQRKLLGIKIDNHLA